MTIAPELSARILRLYDVEKWRVGTISRLLCVHRDTVHRVLAQSGLPTPSTPLRPSRIDVYRAFILETMTKFPELTAVRLFGMVSERGYRVRESDQESTFRPYFSTTASSLSAMPLGRFVPASHFWTVDSLVLR